MQINRYTDYAYRVLMFLAVNKGERITRAQIAEHYVISQEHLRKIIHNLSKLGYVKTFSGRGGGINLNKPLNEINVGDIFVEFEGLPPIFDCYESKCPLRNSCNLNDLFFDARTAFLKELHKQTMDQLVDNPRMKASLLRH